MFALGKATELSCAASAVPDPELQLAYRTLARLWTNLAKQHGLLSDLEVRAEVRRLLDIEAVTLKATAH